MIKQILFFKFKKNIQESDIQILSQEYKSLIGKTPLQSVEFGKNTSTEGFDKGFIYAAIASFPNKESVDTFLQHPDHVSFSNKILDPMIEDFILIEIEV